MSEQDIKALLALMQRALRGGYLDLADWLREQNTVASIEERILQGNYADAITGIDQASLKLAADIQESYVTSAQHAAEWLDGKVDDKLIRFDTASPDVIARAQANQLELVHGFQLERNKITQQITQRAMVEGAQSGINPRQIAQDFRDSIGLTPTQESHVASYRRALETGDYTNALDRELSNGNADRSIASAHAKGKPLTPAQVDQYTEQYRSNYLDHRAETIARTESLRNTNAGASDAIQQAVDRGDVESDVLIKTWHAGPRTKDARETHQQMNGVTAKWGEDFAVPGRFGPVLMSQPGDPRGGVENTANCRCTMSTSFDLDKLVKNMVRKGFLRARIDRVLKLVAA
jgi:hypothetical protein